MRYVEEKYGKESVAQIVTFGKMLPRNATRDAARVLGLDYGAGDRLAKLIPEPIMGRSKSFDEYLVEEPDLRRAYDSEPEARQIIDTARGLEGIVRNAGIHAAAVVIADRPLTDIVPRAADGGPRRSAGPPGERSYKVVTQYSMKPIEEIGLLKMDFLGPAQPRRDRGLPVDHRGVHGRAARHGDAAARRPDDVRDDGPRRLDRRVPVRVRGHARRAAQGQARPSSRTWSRSTRSTGRAPCATSTPTRATSATRRSSPTSTSACARSPRPPTR